MAIKHAILRRPLKILFWIILSVTLLYSSIYIPLFQQSILRAALKTLNSPDATEIKVDRFSLRFPISISASGVEIFQKGDTLLSANYADVDIKLLPFFTGNVDINNITFREVFLKIGHPDSTLFLYGNVNKLHIDPSDINLRSKLIDVSNLQLSGGNINIVINPDTLPPTPPTPVDWQIKVAHTHLNNVDMRMRMLPSFEYIGATIPSLTVNDINANLKDKNISIQNIDTEGITASVLTPSIPQAEIPDQPNPYPSTPTTIHVAHTHINAPYILYGVNGAKPSPGLDLNHLALTNVDVEVDSIFNRAEDISALLSNLYAVEQSSGVEITAATEFNMDSSTIKISDFSLKTQFSTISLNAEVGNNFTKPDSAAALINLAAQIDPIDINRLLPSLASTIDQLPQNRKVDISLNAKGTLADIHLSQFKATMPQYITLDLSGDICNVTSEDNIKADISIDGSVRDTRAINHHISAGSTSAASFKLPPLSLNGKINVRGKNIQAYLKSLTGNGTLAMDASLKGTSEAYNFDLSTDNLPISSFLPTSGIGNTSIRIKATGSGFNFTNPRTNLAAEISSQHLIYNDIELAPISIVADLHQGNVNLSLSANNEALSGNIVAKGNISRDKYSFNISSDIRSFNLQSINLSDTTFNGNVNISADIDYKPSQGYIAVNSDIRNITMNFGSDNLSTANIRLIARADSLVDIHVDNNDLHIYAYAPISLNELSCQFDNFSTLLDSELTQRDVHIDSLQNQFPKFTLSVVAGTNNILHSYLSENGLLFNALSINATNDSLLDIKATASSLHTGSYDIDDLRLSIYQMGNRLNYKASIDNQPGTMDDFAHVSATGYIDNTGISAHLFQKNIKGKVGFNFGALAAINDSTAMLRFTQLSPVIGYMPWHVNVDNYIALNYRHPHIDANLAMSNNESSIKIFTNHNDLNHLIDHSQEDLNVIIDNIKIQEWITLNPFAPPVKGDLSSNIKININEQNITGKGSVTIKDLIYGRDKVGTLNFDVDVSTNPSGALYATTALNYDGKNIIEAHGTLNDTTAAKPFLLDLSLNKLPLKLANPFIGTETGTLKGFLNGKMDVTGSISQPVLNGYLQFDSAAMTLRMLGSALNFSNEKISVDSSHIKFDSYDIYGMNENPLTINGTVDITNFSNIGIDLAMNAADMQVVGAKYRKGAEMYGNAFISLDGTAKGNLTFIRANANLFVLPGTNVTYVIPGGVETVTSRSSSDVVKFVNFNDSTSVAAADSITPSGTLISLDALLHIAQGSTISVDLSEGGYDRIQMNPQGTLNFSTDYMGDTRLTGRLNIDNGYFRYNPPVISLLDFNFINGSYITFNGALMNPQLNVHLQEKIKANVTQEGSNSRLINFLVSIGATGSLQNMNVAFDLSTDDDITVANELQSMTAEQRANQAMNLLLYNTYTGPGTKASSSISGNPLYSFLESQLNSWMAKNVKAVDISFGFDQYDKTLEGSKSTTTSYSYKVSKTFLNDRFKIVVGGNYTTDSDPDENLSQNLINDISFEYILNRAGSMYIRLFRHTGYESILEGEVTQTGVGFVYRRKLRTLRDMFRWVRPNRDNVPEQGSPVPPSQSPQSDSDEND